MVREWYDSHITDVPIIDAYGKQPITAAANKVQMMRCINKRIWHKLESASGSQRVSVRPKCDALGTGVQSHGDAALIYMAKRNQPCGGLRMA